MNNQIRILRIIWLALLLGPLLFLAVIWGKTQPSTTNPEQNNDIFILIVPILGAVSVLTGYLLFKKQMKTIVQMQTPESKMLAFQSALIMRIATIEAPALFSVITFMLSSEKIFTEYLLVFLLFYIPVFPIKERIFRSLGIEERG